MDIVRRAATLKVRRTRSAPVSGEIKTGDARLPTRLQTGGVVRRPTTRPNVEWVTDSIRAITPAGVVTETGIERNVDVLIFATGFHVTTIS